MTLRLRALETGVVGGLALTALLSALYGVLARYLFPQWPSDWTEELSIYAVFWAIWLAAGRLVAEDGHVRSELFTRNAPARLRRLLNCARALSGFIFCAFLAWLGLDVVRLALAFGERSESALQFPLAFYYASMPAGLALMALRYGTALRRALAGGAAAREDGSAA